MSRFAPGQFRQSLQNKIKGVEDPIAVESQPIQIKNNAPESFPQQASAYAAAEMQQIRSSITTPRSTATLPTGSVMHQSVHERMQNFVKDQYKAK